MAQRVDWRAEDDERKVAKTRERENVDGGRRVVDGGSSVDGGRWRGFWEGRGEAMLGSKLTRSGIG